MEKQGRSVSVQSLLLLILLLCILTGCGKKGPPAAPSAKPVPPVTDLRVTLGNNRIWLSWSIPDEIKKSKSAVKKFSVFRSKTSIPDPECPDCPIQYKRIAQIPYESKIKLPGIELPVSYEDRVESGFRYIYYVTILLEDGRESPASNPIQFSY
jgi:predicted small lipoprotein YifL